MDIIVYTTPSCPWCSRVREYLNQIHVDFHEVDIASDKAAAIEMMRKSGQKDVPVIDIEGNIVIGFNQPAIDKLIKQ